MFRERKANRLYGYDYSADALYFVTSCVKDRVCCLGEISNGHMQLNPLGAIAQNQWTWLAEQYSYVILHAFVVMPNHIHGIIEINSGNVGTGRDLSLQGGVKIKSLSELMGAYKTTVSKQIHKIGFTDFAWQRSFHDHIIRNEKSLYSIMEYIKNNPLKWEEDKFYQ